MKFYNITQHPLKIYGLAVADDENRQFYRLPKYMLEKMPRYNYLGRRATGGRVRFCTDSANLIIRMTLGQTKEDINIPLSGSAGADIYLGKGVGSKYLGYIAPDCHTMEEISVKKIFSKKNIMEIVRWQCLHQHCMPLAGRRPSQFRLFRFCKRRTGICPVSCISE